MSDAPPCSAPPPPSWLARLRIPETASDWQLYTDMPGAEQAAADLAAAAREAVGLINEAIRRIHQRLRQHGDLGAQDTEPRAVARDLLTRIAERALDDCL